MELFSAETFWISLIICGFICGFLSMTVAEHKGYAGGVWFGAGFFFGIFGLIAAAGLPKKQEILNTLHKKCPDCAENIRKEAVVCKYCNKRFTKEENEKLESSKNETVNRAESQLFVAVKNKNVKALYTILESDNDIDVNEKDNNGDTALIHATKLEDHSSVELLLKRLADKNLTNNDGKTAVDYAEQSGNKKCLKLLNLYS